MTDELTDEKKYFYRRAESELEMAQRTEVPEAVKAHYALASYYLDKVYDDEADASGQGRVMSDDAPALKGLSGPRDAGARG